VLSQSLGNEEALPNNGCLAVKKVYRYKRVNGQDLVKQKVSLLWSIEDSFIVNTEVVVTVYSIDLSTDLLIEC
jgi:hypothetical protein